MPGGPAGTRSRRPSPTSTCALAFATEHADDLRFTAAKNTWNYWDGARWRRDETLNPLDLAREHCR